MPRLEEVELVAWLQQYAWLEVELPRRLARRPGRRGEPMFCFETALKLCYWADLAYELEVGGLFGTGWVYGQGTAFQREGAVEIRSCWHEVGAREVVDSEAEQVLPSRRAALQA